MYKKLRERLNKKDDSGFTLIELLMVIVILAVLAAVVVFSVGGLNDTSKKSACKAELSTVNTAAEAYYAQNNHVAAATISALITGGVLHQDSDISTTGTPAGAVTTFTSNGYTFTWEPAATAMKDSGGNAYTVGSAGELDVNVTAGTPPSAGSC